MRKGRQLTTLSFAVQLTYGGGQEIRTLDTISGTHDFQSCSFSQLGQPSV